MNRIFKSPFNFLIVFLLLLGTFLHFTPFMNYQRLLYSISEDGYYMLTIARNIALGHGMSVSDGNIPTNGTQPIMTFIMSGIFFLTGGDKILSIKLIIILQWLIVAGASILIWGMSVRLLKHHPEKDKISILAAALWYSSPIILRHTMNGLESGLYALAVLFVLSYIIFRDNPFRFYYSVVTGFFLGITFLVRNDAVFLIAAVSFAYLMPGLYSDNINFGKKLVNIIVIGITTLLTAGPWLLYNQMIFGSIIPISGQAEMQGERLGGNFINLPRVLSEYFTGFISLSYDVQKYRPILLLWIIFVIAAAVFLIKMYRRFTIYQRRLVIISSIFLIMLGGFYSTVFDNYYFLPRYLFPVSAIILIGWSASVFYGIELIKPKFKKISVLSTAVFIILLIIFSVRNLTVTNEHLNFNAVDWVNSNVKEDIWISAFQSGALGYFHDKTINLDGKVNPDALAARKLLKLPEYMVKVNAEYMVDWYDRKVFLMKNPLVEQNYDVLVNDSINNLAVLKKKHDK